jgi:hypothetical protein
MKGRHSRTMGSQTETPRSTMAWQVSGIDGQWGPILGDVLLVTDHSL